MNTYEHMWTPTQTVKRRLFLRSKRPRVDSPDSFDGSLMPLMVQHPSTFLSRLLGAWPHPRGILMVAKWLLHHHCIKKRQKEEGAKGKKNRCLLDVFLIFGFKYTTYHISHSNISHITWRYARSGDATSPQSKSLLRKFPHSRHFSWHV